MLKKHFSALTRKEIVLWACSALIVMLSNLLSGKTEPVTLIATLIGVTALIFIAKGDVLGQILTLLFSVLYAIVSWRFRYFGEMITYLGMTAPIAAMSIVSWLKHPYEEGKIEVKIHRLTKKQHLILPLLTASVTILFYFILKFFDTPNLLISTISVTTSFLASTLMFYRNPYYALAYAANDIVLIVLWALASIENIGYLPMVVCFLMFLINDLYGFVSWKKREKAQKGTID